MPLYRYRLTTLALAIAIILAGCGPASPYGGDLTDADRERTELEPAFGEPLHEEFPQYSRDPYAQVDLEEIQAAWEAWERPAYYDPEVAMAIDPSNSNPYKVAYMSLLAWLAFDLEGMERYWSPGILQTYHSRESSADEAGLEQCLKIARESEPRITVVATRLLAYPKSKTLGEDLAGPAVDLDIWSVELDLAFDGTCPGRSTDVLGLKAHVSWHPAEHRYEVWFTGIDGVKNEADTAWSGARVAFHTNLAPHSAF